MKAFKLSISNIAWASEHDTHVYTLMKKYGFQGLEIAPTRIFTDSPYTRLEEAKEWSQKLFQEHGFCISSMQSIWYGRQESIFGTDEERVALLDYTKQAIDFAQVIGCGNLVFGCPRNRNLPDGIDDSIAIGFFNELGEYAYSRGTVIGMESNPTIYETNYINDTASAIDLIERVNSRGFKLNLDIGTMIYNKENLELLKGKVDMINHVHISEPRLKPIERRSMHKEIAKILKDVSYDGFVSIEMGRVDDLKIIEEKMSYLKEVFR